MAGLKKTEVINGVPLVYAPAGINRDRITTITLTGTGTASMSVVHMDNDPVTVFSGVQLPQPPQVLFGVGYESITITNDGGGTVFVTIGGARG